MTDNKNKGNSPRPTRPDTSSNPSPKPSPKANESFERGDINKSMDSRPIQQPPKPKS